MPLQATSGAASYDAFGGGVPAAPPTYIEDVFSTFLYTGNGSTQTITNGIDLSTNGGLVWLKYRSGSAGSVYHHVYDSARGKSGNASFNYLYPNVSDPQGTGAFGPTSFNTTGFSLNDYLNESTIPYVSWTWRKQSKFFDIQTWTGSGANRTISHALGSVPACIIVKRTDTAADWQVYHRSLANTEYLVLNSTAAKATGATRWNSTTPTSSVFSLGTDATVNASGGTYVAYIFAHDAGGFGLTGTDNVISCGSFTTDGGGVGSVTFGWEPQWLLMKDTSGADEWILVDDMRGFGASPSAASPTLFPNKSNSEGAYGDYYKTATTFTSAAFSASHTYIYIAIRRGPMKVPTTGTSVFAPNIGNNVSGSGLIANAGFPVDAHFEAYKDTTGRFWFDRLRGDYNYLSTASTAAETAAGQRQFANMSGAFFSGTFNFSSAVVYDFRRAPSFFDEVCYTGTGSATTFSHNLQAVPELMIVKRRSAAFSWTVYAASLAATEIMVLNTTAAIQAGSDAWNSTRPTSSVFSVSPGSNSTNASGSTYVAYLFATCAGVSKVGSYTGTATTKQIDCGFTAGARFVLIKRTDDVGDWYVWDTARGIIAGNDPYLLLNSTAAEVTSTDYIDTYSAGFEISSTAPAAINANGGSFIFLAIS